jgi:hypothetical protein
MVKKSKWIMFFLCLQLSPMISFAGDEPTMMRSINAKVFIGKGTASISYQCDQDTEKPCPPKTELKRRALEVAKIYAMQNICQQAGININSVMMVVSGRMKAGEIKTESGNKLKSLEFLDPVQGDDEISIKIVAEVE